MTGTIQLSGITGDMSFGNGAPSLDTIDLGGVSRGFDVDSGGIVTTTGTIGNGGLSKTGTGTWSFTNFDQTLTTLSFSGGSITTGTKVLNLSDTTSPLTVTNSPSMIGTINFTGASGNISFGSGTPTLDGMDLGGITREINVALGGVATLSGVVSSGGITKTGLGTSRVVRRLFQYFRRSYDRQCWRAPAR
jgi:hypothetical protein